MMFKFTEDNYKREFSLFAESVIAQGDRLTVPERVELIEILTEDYVKIFNKIPPSRDLELLANYLLLEHLTDRNPDKVTNHEFPVLSDRQQRTRRSKEFTKEESTLDFIKLRKSNKNYDINKRNTKTIQE